DHSARTVADYFDAFDVELFLTDNVYHTQNTPPDQCPPLNVSSPILLAFAYLADGIRRMKHENYLMFYIRIRHYIKTGNSQS
ncbi:hypothetical protein KU620_24570, partial [Salmonella enterica subsp. enterica serovar Mbandaka]|nr:hypothetical protein [Salmonella enterica subsp. enterica serovar Mbandaka]